jgi:hypothetical protein
MMLVRAFAPRCGYLPARPGNLAKVGITESPQLSGPGPTVGPSPRRPPPTRTGPATAATAAPDARRCPRAE